MTTYRVFGLAVCLLPLAACAVMDPYIRHDRPPHADQIANCANQSPDRALRYACGMSVRLERARSEIVRTRSGLTSALFPMAGIVGYNSSRGINAATNAAITAGGLAGYSAIATMAQFDRIRIYDNGHTAINCAIGVYQQARATGAPESLDRALLRRRLTSARNRLNQMRATVREASPAAPSATADEAEEKKIATLRESAASSHQAIMQLEDLLDVMQLKLDDGAPNRLLESKLMNSVRRTISAVNAQLTLTIPSNPDAFGGAVEGLGSLPRPGGTDGTEDSAKDSIAALVAGTERMADPGLSSAASTLEAEFDALLALYRQVQAEPVEKVLADFTPCTYAAVSDVGVQRPGSRLMLGPNDESNGGTVALTINQKKEYRIFGGVPPYEPAASGPQPPLVVDIVSRKGVPYLQLTAPASAPQDGKSYDVSLTDALGQSRKSLTVTVN